MHAPEFWRSDNVLARLLDPIGQIVGAVTTRRVARAKPLRVEAPVICVGNVSVGGTGKTPVAASIAARLRDVGKNPAVLMRGYGGNLKGPVKVDDLTHTHEDVGDEALLHATTSPVWVSKNRSLGALEAIKNGACTLVMDDGHQHTTLAKDLSLVVVDGTAGFGNGRITPAGPLREPIESGLARADAIILMGEDPYNMAGKLSEYAEVLRAYTAPGPEWHKLRGQRVVAFAGIGTPEKFLHALTAVGAKVVAFHPFHDHYGYADADIQSILDEAFSIEALPVTTLKDAVRLAPDQRQQVNVLTVDVQWLDRTALNRLLDQTLKTKP
jgi:tetraacyldisaccharide 4'-kinase